MSFFFAHPKTKRVPDLTGLQLHTSINSIPIPIIYGMPRTTMNLLYANGYHSRRIGAGGGKGLLTGGKGGQSQTQYYVTFIGAICEGPITGIAGVFDNLQVYTPTSAPPGKVFTIFYGSPTQAPWSVISTSWPGDAFGYKDTAYIGFYDWPMDSPASLPAINFIPIGRFAGTCPLNVFVAPNGDTYLMDADPAQCIYDFFTNAVYGVGFPVTFISTTSLFTSENGFNSDIGDSALSTYCQAVGLGWSLVLNNSEPASSILDRWCKNLVVAPVWTGTVLKFIPYFDGYTGANPNYDVAHATVPLKFFRANVTPLFDLTDDDFIQADEGEDPVVVTRIDTADVKNIVRLDYKQRGVQYNPSTAEAKDENAVELYGPRIERLGIADEFTHENYADVSVQMQLQRNVAIRNIYTFRLPWAYCVLEPMDIVTLTDDVLGLDQFPVRIRSIEEDEKGILTIIAEEFPVGAATPTFYERQRNIPPAPPVTNVEPPPVNPPMFVEPTIQMLVASGDPAPTLFVGLSGGPDGTFSEDWGGANIFLSNDGVTYVQVATVNQAARMGVTTAPLPAFTGSNPDNTNTLSVNLSQSDAILDSVTSVQAAAGLSLCAIVDVNGDLELLSYTTATLTGANTFNLTGLYRGLYGTVACAHGTDSQFMRVDNYLPEQTIPPEFNGTIVYFKFQSFNVWGLQPEDISTCVAYTYTPQGWGVNLAVNPIFSTLIAGGTVDLLSATSDPIDLNSGGIGACAPIVFTLDLE